MKTENPGSVNRAETLGRLDGNRRQVFSYEGRVFKTICVFWQRALFVAAALLFLLFADLKIFGREKLRKLKSGPLIIIANHKSFLDPLVLGLCFPFFSKSFPLRFMAKDVLMKNIGRRLLFRSFGCYPALKGQGLEVSLRTPSEILRAGGTVLFFPEGIRIREEGLGEPRPGAAELASRFPAAPILPIAITGTHKAGKFGWLFRRPRLKLRAKIGEPFCYQDKASGIVAGEGIKVLMGEIEKNYAEIARGV